MPIVIGVELVVKVGSNVNCCVGELVKSMLGVLVSTVKKIVSDLPIFPVASLYKIIVYDIH